MHQIFLHLPDLSVFFPLFRPQSLRSLRASHRALSCLSSPLLIFHFSSAESAQAPLSHVNLWVVRVSDPPSPQTWTSLVALQSIRPDYWSLPCCRGSNSSRLICIHPSEQQFSQCWEAAVQQTAGASRRLFAPPRFSRALIRFSNPSSALFKSSLLDNTELFLNSNHHKHSATHTHMRATRSGEASSCSLCLLACGAWRRFNTSQLRYSRHKAPTKTRFQCIFHFCKAFRAAVFNNTERRFKTPFWGAKWKVKASTKTTAMFTGIMGSFLMSVPTQTRCYPKECYKHDKICTWSIL